MLIKEYRIPLPLTSEEYKIAQLYMIAKKSRQESHGTGSGIEILVNEPYNDGPGPEGTGQYTKKIYHVGSHLPAWVKSMIPKSALSVEEEAWNAYPYTKTRFTCPFVEKFSIEIETYYFDDGGHQDNVFDLSTADLKIREVDLIDIVKDQVYGAEYKEEEDPTLFMSKKTGRGPLNDQWIENYWQECQGQSTPLPNGKAIMCAYKLCKVEFRYWGMQTKIEKFIHDSALRKTMLQAHRQAWAWFDEWWGLSIADIRCIEKETQDILAKKFGGEQLEANENPDEDQSDPSSSSSSGDGTSSRDEEEVHARDPCNRIEPLRDKGSGIAPRSPRTPVADWTDCGDDDRKNNQGFTTSLGTSEEIRVKESWSRSASKSTLNSYSQASWRMESIRRDSNTSGSDDEFFDCQANIIPAIRENMDEPFSDLHKWSSLEIIPQEMEDHLEASKMSPVHVSTERHRYMRTTVHGEEKAYLSSPSHFSHQPSTCPTAVLILVVHAGSVLDNCAELVSKKSDVTTFRGAFEAVLRQQYPRMVGRVCVRLVSVDPVCAESLNVLSSLSPIGMDMISGAWNSLGEQPQVPLGALPVLGSITPEYKRAVDVTIRSLNTAWQSFLTSDEGFGFTGQVCVVGDSVGGVLCYDALCRGVDIRRKESSTSENRTDKPYNRMSSYCGVPEPHSLPHYKPVRSVSETLEMQDSSLNMMQPSRKMSLPHGDKERCQIEFEVNDLFLFGCPLALIIVHRKISTSASGRKDADDQQYLNRPSCHQVYNLFHPTDPLAVRLEPLLSARFAFIPPVTVPRFTKYPLGNGHPTHLWECIQSHRHLFAKEPDFHPLSYGTSAVITSTSNTTAPPGGCSENLPVEVVNALSQRWWGDKRLDYALYCPDGLSNFPNSVLPHLFHASYWESFDVVSFIIRQIFKNESAYMLGNVEHPDETPSFMQEKPKEKWLKKRTSVKIKNVGANHRGNDTIVREGSPQVLHARFTYGPLDVVALSGEKVDVHVCRNPPSGEWQLITTCLTDKNGRLDVTVPLEKQLPLGIYPVKMVVRGDGSFCSSHAAVLPPNVQCVVFSVDGSFTASVSVTGKDPKVRAGAVDVVRHWQELGYLIIYITGRPDMQQRKVVSWLSQHNFPHGLVSFADGLSTDPLGHKADYLRSIIKDCEVVIEAAYGSSKDISMYLSVGLQPSQIYIVGKVNKKHSGQAQVLADGYSVHLSQLSSLGRCVPARTNPSLVFPKSFSGLPSQTCALRRRRSAKRTSSYPVLGSVSQDGSSSNRQRRPKSGSSQRPI